MKKHLLLIATLLIGAVTSQAQIINPGFETWSTDAFATGAKDPNSGAGTTGWWDFNMLNNALVGGSPISVFQDSTMPTPHGGKYCAKIVSVALTNTSYGYVKAYGVRDTMGVLMTANISVSTKVSVIPGEPFTQRISSYNFFYRYAPNGVDTADCSVVLTHYSGGARHTLGQGVLTINKATNTWTAGSVPIFWDSASGNPDSILVLYSACNLATYSKPHPGDTLYVDDASVVAGIQPINGVSASVNVYPNPASTTINFQVTGSTVARTEIYDITGKKINTYNVQSGSFSISMEGYAAGMYIYKLYDKSGAEIKVGRFTVAAK